jgi:hypothetical protein
MPTSKAKTDSEHPRNKKEAEIKAGKISLFPTIIMTDHTPLKTMLIPVSG